MYERTYHNQVLKSDQIAKTKDKKKIWKKILFALIFIGIATGIFFLLRAPKLQVSKFSISGTSVVDTFDIESSIKHQLKGKWLWFFPRTSIFLINKNKLEERLKNDFSRIESTNVKVSDFNTISVRIKEYAPLYLWCTDELSTHIEQVNSCYFMDKKGFVYYKSPLFSGSAYQKIIVNRPLKELPFKALEDKELNFIVDLTKGLSDINIIPTGFRLVSWDRMEILFLHNSDTSKIIIDPNIESKTILEYIFSALRTKPFGDLFNDRQKRLIYIDLRFSNKVLYKFDD